MVCVFFPPGSIWKYWISVNEDTTSFKQIVQMCKWALLQKPGVFTLFSRHLQGKTRYKIRQGWWFALWVGDPISFFVKYYYLNLTFIQVLKGALLKNAKTKTKTIFSKTMLRPKNCFIKQEVKEKQWKKRKKNKNEQKSNNNNNFFTFTFLYRKIYILLENI